MEAGEVKFKYDCCVSFAGEQRKYVEEFVRAVQAKGASVFYDNDNIHKLWGRDLTGLLNAIYGKQSRYCVMFISVDYKEKKWTSHEKTAASARHLEDKGEYILPVRFDDTEIDVVLPSQGYLDARQKNPEQLAQFFMDLLYDIDGILPRTSEILISNPNSSPALVTVTTENSTKESGDFEISYKDLLEAFLEYNSDVDKFARSRPNSTYPIKKAMKKIADELRKFAESNSSYFDKRSLEITLDSLEKTAGINFVEGALEAAEEALRDLQRRLYLRP